MGIFDFSLTGMGGKSGVLCESFDSSINDILERVNSGGTITVRNIDDLISRHLTRHKLIFEKMDDIWERAQNLTVQETGRKELIDILNDAAMFCNRELSEIASFRKYYSSLSDIVANYKMYGNIITPIVRYGMLHKAEFKANPELNNIDFHTYTSDRHHNNNMIKLFECLESISDFSEISGYDSDDMFNIATHLCSQYFFGDRFLEVTYYQTRDRWTVIPQLESIYNLAKSETASSNIFNPNSSAAIGNDNVFLVIKSAMELICKIITEPENVDMLCNPDADITGFRHQVMRIINSLMRYYSAVTVTELHRFMEALRIFEFKNALENKYHEILTLYSPTT